MLQQIMEHLNNYFVKKPRRGVWKFEDGALSMGSLDGVHDFDWDQLQDNFLWYGTYTGEPNPTNSPELELKEGQRFLVFGSDLNDGVYTYHADGITNDDDNAAAGLADETFAGTICALAVPPAVIALSQEISQWVDTYGAAVMASPYHSETFNGYSYTLKSGGSNGGSGQLGWQDIFRSRLDRWRRLFL